MTISSTTNLEWRRNLFDGFHEPFVMMAHPDRLWGWSTELVYRSTFGWYIWGLNSGSWSPSFESIFAAVRTVQLAVFGCISIAADSSISPDKFSWFSIAAKHAIIPPMLLWVQKWLHNVFCKRVLIKYCSSQYDSHFRLKSRLKLFLWPWRKISTPGKRSLTDFKRRFISRAALVKLN